MGYRGTSDLPTPLEQDRNDGIDGSLPAALATTAACLEQLLEAYRDIADLDDIHQAAQRLALVQEWIRSEAERTAADPIFLDLRLV